MGRGGRRFLSLPVITVISLMGFVYYSTVFVFVESWLGLRSAAGICSALVFSYFTLMCLASFCASVVIDPGQVPASFAPDMEGSDGNVWFHFFLHACYRFSYIDALEYLWIRQLIDVQCMVYGEEVLGVIF